jgi:PTH1 family peptidyl-tRNA hydrolase
MNLSGSQLRPWVRRAGWEASQDLLVVVDEVALPLGRFRLRATGSAGGHNGLKSIEAAVGSSDYARLRIGILPDETQRPSGPLADFVTSPFGKSEREHIDQLLPTLADLTEMWVRDGVLAAMNAYNKQR